MKPHADIKAMLARMECAYQEAIAALRFARHGEIEVLSRKAARRAGTTAAFRVRHCIDVFEQEDA